MLCATRQEMIMEEIDVELRRSAKYWPKEKG